MNIEKTDIYIPGVHSNSLRCTIDQLRNCMLTKATKINDCSWERNRLCSKFFSGCSNIYGPSKNVGEESDKSFSQEHKTDDNSIDVIYEKLFNESVPEVEEVFPFSEYSDINVLADYSLSKTVDGEELKKKYKSDYGIFCLRPIKFEKATENEIYEWLDNLEQKTKHVSYRLRHVYKEETDGMAKYNKSNLYKVPLNSHEYRKPHPSAYFNNIIEENLKTTRSQIAECQKMMKQIKYPHLLS